MASFVISNANGLHDTQMFPDKPRRFLQHLRNSNPDFAFISETHFLPDLNPWKFVHGAVFSSFTHKQRGGVPSSPSGRGSPSPIPTQILRGGRWWPQSTQATIHLSVCVRHLRPEHGPRQIHPTCSLYSCIRCFCCLWRFQLCHEGRRPFPTLPTRCNRTAKRFLNRYQRDQHHPIDTREEIVSVLRHARNQHPNHTCVATWTPD